MDDNLERSAGVNSGAFLLPEETHLRKINPTDLRYNPYSRTHVHRKR
jgi:hypothetical protein